MLGPRSRKHLEGVHPDLVRVIERADSLGVLDFSVSEGLRSPKRQAELLAHGASTTMKSRHLTGHAVDLAVLIDGKVRWDWPLYAKLNAVVQTAADEIKVPVEWGGNWISFKDGCHWQLPWTKYPETHLPSG